MKGETEKAFSPCKERNRTLLFSFCGRGGSKQKGYRP